MKKLKVTIEAQEAKTIYVSIASIDQVEFSDDMLDFDVVYCEDQHGNIIEDDEEVWNKGANILLDNIKWNAEIVEE